MQDIEIIICPSDADTTIVKKALELANDTVTVVADDTDILCLLLNHLLLSEN